jgi:hypothetical protein
MQNGDRNGKPGVGPRDLTPTATDPDIILMERMPSGAYRMVMLELLTPELPSPAPIEIGVILDYLISEAE